MLKNWNRRDLTVSMVFINSCRQRLSLNTCCNNGIESRIKKIETRSNEERL